MTERRKAYHRMKLLCPLRAIRVWTSVQFIRHKSWPPEKKGVFVHVIAATTGWKMPVQASSKIITGRMENNASSQIYLKRL